MGILISNRSHQRGSLTVLQLFTGYVIWNIFEIQGMYNNISVNVKDSVTGRHGRELRFLWSQIGLYFTSLAFVDAATTTK